MIVVDHTSDLRLIVTDAEKTSAAKFASVFIQCVAVFHGRLSAAILMTQLDVHNARHRISAVGGRSTVLQDFDAFDRGFRDREQINERERAAGSNWIWRDSLAID